MEVVSEIKSLRLCPFKSAPEVNELQRLVSGMVSTIVVDMEGDVCLPEACKTKRYFDATRAVDLDHSPYQIIGTNRNLVIRPNTGVHTVTYVTKTQLGQDVLTMVMEQIIRGLSIQWDPETLFASAPSPDEMDRFGPKCRRIFRSYDLIRYAFTAQPCNPAALIEGVKSASWQREQEDTWEHLRDLMDARKIKATSAVAAGLPLRYLRRVETKRLRPMVVDPVRALILSAGMGGMVVAS